MNFGARCLILSILLVAACDREPLTNGGEEAGPKPDSPLGRVGELLTDVEEGRLPTPTEKPEEEPVVEEDPVVEQPESLEIPVAKPVPDKPGFVVSPFTGKWIDVSDVETGTIVADPQFAPEEKKYFRVPEFPEVVPEVPEEAGEGSAEPAEEATSAPAETPAEDPARAAE